MQEMMITLQKIIITETKDTENSKVEIALTEIDTKMKYKIKSMKNNIYIYIYYELASKKNDS